MDFITDLPIVKAKNSILDVVNCLTKMAHFTLVPSRSRQKRQLSQFWTGLSNYMDSSRKLCPIEALNLHPSSGGAYSSSLESTFGYRQLSTPKQMDKSNGQTRHSSNTFAALWATNRTTGWPCYLKQSLLITTQCMHRLVSVRSLPITAFMPGSTLKFLETR